MLAAVIENDLCRVAPVDYVGIGYDISVRGGDNAAAPGVVILAVIVAEDLYADDGGTAFFIYRAEVEISARIAVFDAQTAAILDKGNIYASVP